MVKYFQKLYYSALGNKRENFPRWDFHILPTQSTLQETFQTVDNNNNKRSNKVSVSCSHKTMNQVTST